MDSKSQTTVLGINHGTSVGIVVAVDSRLTAGHYGQKVTDCHSKLFQIGNYVFIAYAGGYSSVWEHVKEETVSLSSNFASMKKLASFLADLVSKYVKIQNNQEMSIDLLVFGTMNYGTDELEMYSIKKRNDTSSRHTPGLEEKGFYVGSGGGKSVKRYLGKVPFSEDGGVDYCLQYVVNGVKEGIGGSWLNGGGIQAVAITKNDGVIFRKWVSEREGCTSDYRRADGGLPSPP